MGIASVSLSSLNVNVLLGRSLAAMSSDFKMDEKVIEEPPRGYEGGRPEIDPARERKLVRKLDLHIVPVVMLLYLFSFLDRYDKLCIYCQKTTDLT